MSSPITADRLGGSLSITDNRSTWHGLLLVYNGRIATDHTRRLHVQRYRRTCNSPCHVDRKGTQYRCGQDGPPFGGADVVVANVVRVS